MLLIAGSLVNKADEKALKTHWTNTILWTKELEELSRKESFMTMLLTLIYFFPARAQERDQLYCECLMKQYHSIDQGHSKKNPERELAQPTGFENSWHEEETPRKRSYIQNGIFMLQFWNFYNEELIKWKCFTITCVNLVQGHLQLYL